MVSPERIYLLLFVVLSALIGWGLRWPASRRGWGLATGGYALGLATLLGGYLATAGGAGIFQQPPPLGWPWLQDALETIWLHVRAVLDLAQQWAPGLAANLVLILLFLALYLAFKLMLVLLAWLVHGGHWLLGGKAVPPLPGYTAFLKTTARWGLLLMGGLLGSLPAVMTLHSAVSTFFNLLFWAGAWIALLELGQWLHSGQLAQPAAHATDAATRVPAAPSLQPVYAEYLRLHADATIGNQALLFYHSSEPPLPEPAAPPLPGSRTDGDIARSLVHRLQNYLSPRLLENLVNLANRYEHGGDLVFTETLCGYHVLLLAELIQYHKNRSEVTLLICPPAATAQVETALQEQVELHQLRLTHRWAVLGRDPVGSDAQVDVLICPANALEQQLIHALHALPLLHRLRLLICLDIQALPLSTVRLALRRVWLRVPGQQVRVVAQAEPYQDMEQQVRYLLNRSPEHLLRTQDLTECRLNPQLLAQRYRLVWDAHSPCLRALLHHYFPGYPGTLELGRLLLLAPWQHTFAVVDLDPAEHHDEDSLEHLRDDLLAQYGQQDLLSQSWVHRHVGHVYAAGAGLVYQCADLANLPLALDHNTNFSGASETLLNVVCGHYLLRDYFRACLEHVENPHQLTMRLRPLAVRPQGSLPEIAVALGGALQAGSDQRGLSRADITAQYLHLAPPSLLAAFGIRADRDHLQHLFAITQVNPPPVDVRLDGDHQPRYSIPPDSPIAPPRYHAVRNEAGEPIGYVPTEDHGLRYAKHQLLQVGGKFQWIREVDETGVWVLHQESQEKNLSRHYVFARRYAFMAGDRYREGTPQRQTLSGDLQVDIEHLHTAFTAVSEGYWALPADRRFPPQGQSPTFVPLEPPLCRVHKLQNVAHLSLQQVELVGTADLSVVAFTLCAVLQDCLDSLFPPQCAQLAVVSPQSSRFDPAQDERVRCYHRLYPVLDPVSEEPDTAASAVRWDLYLFEDADHDLGVIRALCDGHGFDVLLRLARDYLAWAITQPADQLYHSYGSGDLPVCLDYPGALALLDKLAQRWVGVP